MQAALARAPHPHVCPVLALGEAMPSPASAASVSAPGLPDAAAGGGATASRAVATDGALVLVHPALEIDLHSYMRQRGRLPLAEARALFAQLAAAVAHCHAQRVALRDVKLGKVFFTDARRTTIALADLEGAHVVSGAGESMLVTDQRAAPAYVSPEALAQLPHDPAAADMWALGVILHVLLTGSYPFQETQCVLVWSAW